MSDDVARLEAIYTAALSGDEAAQRQVYEISSQVEVMPVVLQLLKGSANPSIRFYAAITLNQIVKASRGISPEVKASLFGELAALLETETEHRNRRYLCTVAAEMRLGEGEFDEIPRRASELAMELLGKGKLDSAFVLAAKAIDYIPREQQVVVANRVYEPCCTTILECGDEELRIAAMELMQVLADDTNDDALTTMIQNPGNFAGMVAKVTERIMLHGGSPAEALAFFGMMENVIKSLTPFFVEQHREFALLVTNLMTNKEINPYVRLPAARMLETVYDLSVDLLMDVSNTVLQNELVFATELCEIDETSDDYTFPCDLVTRLADLIEHEKFFPFVFELVMKMIETKADAPVTVALTMLGCLIRCTMDEMLECEDTVLQVVVACLGHPQALVAEAAGKVVHVMCEVLDNDMTPMIDELATALMKRLDIMWCEKALNLLLSVTEEPPSSIDDMISQTLGLLKTAPKQAHEKIVQLLCSELTSYDKVNAELYAVVGPVMVGLLGGEIEQKALAVKCFSILIGICPEQALADVPNIMPVVLGLFSDQDYERNSLCCECINGIVQHQCSSVIPFAGDIIKALETVHQLSLIEPEGDDEDGEQADLIFNSWSLMKLAALATMVTMCSLLPEQLSGRFTDIFNLLCRNLSATEPEVAVAACDNLSILAEGYQAVGADGGPFFEKILSAIQSEAGEMLVAGWRNLGIIMELFGPDTVKRFAPNINGCLLGAFTHARNVYNQKGDSSEIARDLQEPIFFTLNNFIKVLKADAGPYLQEYIPILQSLAANGRRKSHGKAAYSLALIASVIPEAAPLLQAATQVAMADLNAKATDTRVSAMSTLNTALHVSPEAMAPAKDKLIEYTTQIIKSVANGAKECSSLSDTAACLWLSLARAYQLPVDDSIISSIFNIVQLRYDQDYLVYFCEFLVYASTAYPAVAQQQLPSLAAAVLASKPSLLRSIPHESLQTLVACAQANMDLVRHNLAFSEVLMRNVERNIKSLVA